MDFGCGIVKVPKMNRYELSDENADGDDSVFDVRSTLASCRFDHVKLVGKVCLSGGRPVRHPASLCSRIHNSFMLPLFFIGRTFAMCHDDNPSHLTNILHTYIHSFIPYNRS